VRALLSFQFAILALGSAPAAAAPAHNGPRDPNTGEHWVELGTIAADDEDGAPELRGAVVYIDRDDMSYVGDGSKDDGHPVNLDLWFILKNPVDGPKGKYAEENVRTFVMCDTKKFFNVWDTNYFAADGTDLGYVHESDAKKQYIQISLGSVGAWIYDYACPKAR
jgi:hypothetical protein